MCAMMPMLRVFASGVCLGITDERSLPPVVRERFVGLRHPVRVLALLDGATAKVCGVDELVRELLLHRLAVAARARVADDPADAERQTPVGIDLHGNLVVRSADAPR